jgi:hypothetical protein
MRPLYLPFCLFVVLAGAQQTARPAPGEPPADKTSSETKASVYVYRFKMDRGASGAFPVYCDDTHLAQLDNGRYLLAKVEPGIHLFRSSDKQSGIELDLKPGQKYYIQIEAAGDAWSIHGRVTLVAPEQGAYAVKKIRPIDAKKIKNTQMVIPADQINP